MSIWQSDLTESIPNGMYVFIDSILVAVREEVIVIDLTGANQKRVGIRACRQVKEGLWEIKYALNGRLYEGTLMRQETPQR